MTAATSQSAWDALRRECDELAAQNEVMRGLLLCGRPKDGAVGTRDDEVTARQQAFDEALALPNTAADILRQRDARTLREAAHIFDNEAGLAGCDNMTTVAGDRLRRMSKELERKNG